MVLSLPTSPPLRDCSGSAFKARCCKRKYLPLCHLSSSPPSVSHFQETTTNLSPVYQVEEEEKRDPSEAFQAPGSNLSFSLPIALIYLDWWNFISHKLLVAKGPFLHSKSKGQDPEHPIPIGPAQQPSPGPSQLPEQQRG